MKIVKATGLWQVNSGNSESTTGMKKYGLMSYVFAFSFMHYSLSKKGANTEVKITDCPYK